MKRFVVQFISFHKSLSSWYFRLNGVYWFNSFATALANCNAKLFKNRQNSLNYELVRVGADCTSDQETKSQIAVHKWQFVKQKLKTILKDGRQCVTHFMQFASTFTLYFLSLQKIFWNLSPAPSINNHWFIIYVRSNFCD